MVRTVLALSVGLLLAACQLHEAPPAESAAAPPPRSEEPAPLPPEETPPAEQLPPAPAAPPPEAGITATGAPTRGKLPKSVIDEQLKAAQGGVLACYERALKTKPDLRGSVNVDFVVSTEGKVVHAEATSAEDELPDEATTSCILSEIRKLEFPPPTGGRVFIHYPLKLEPPKPSGS
jgi:hypothetical protein